MQPCFFSLSGVLPGRRGDRAHQGLGREGLRQAGPERRRAQLRRHRRVARRAGPGRRCPRAVSATAPPPAAVPADAPDFVQRVTAVMLAGDGDLLPVSALPRRRHLPDGHRQVREAGDRRGDPDLGPRRLHRLRQVRHRLPPRRDPHEGLRARRPSPALPTASSPRRSGRRTSTATCSRSRSRPTTAPAAACASTCARPSRSPRSATRPSTWSRPTSTATSSGCVGLLRLDPARSTATCCPTTRSRARRCWSRCSSSPAPAPAAARRRTSSWSPSCSATA